MSKNVFSLYDVKSLNNLIILVYFYFRTAAIATILDPRFKDRVIPGEDPQRFRERVQSWISEEVDVDLGVEVFPELEISEELPAKRRESFYSRLEKIAEASPKPCLLMHILFFIFNF